MVQIGRQWLIWGTILRVTVFFPLEGVLSGELSPEEHFKRGMEAARQHSLVKSYGEHKPPYPAVKEEVMHALKASAQ